MIMDSRLHVKGSQLVRLVTCKDIPFGFPKYSSEFQLTQHSSLLFEIHQIFYGCMIVFSSQLGTFFLGFAFTVDLEETNVNFSSFEKDASIIEVVKAHPAHSEASEQ